MTLIQLEAQKWLCNLQMLHNKHVMVRVGGGWETFESYLLKHDPCRMLQFSRVEGKTSPVSSSSSSRPPTIKELSPDSYLVVAAHYRGKKWARRLRRAVSVVREEERPHTSVFTQQCWCLTSHDDDIFKLLIQSKNQMMKAVKPNPTRKLSGFYSTFKEYFA